MSKNRFIDADEETIKYYIDNQSKDNFDSKESNTENKEFIFQILRKLKDPRIPKVFSVKVL